MILYKLNLSKCLFSYIYIYLSINVLSQQYNIIFFFSYQLGTRAYSLHPLQDDEKCLNENSKKTETYVYDFLDLCD